MSGPWRCCGRWRPTPRADDRRGYHRSVLKRSPLKRSPRWALLALASITLLSCNDRLPASQGGTRVRPRVLSPPAVRDASLAVSRARSDSPTHHREVRLRVDSAVTLAGEFAWPNVTGAAPTPAVLLLSGSGAQTRDGARAELPGYYPFTDLADTLVAAGFAVLRLDDRGVGASTGSPSGATTEELARDASAAVAWLRGQPGVDPARIALVGHSEGALVALLAARRDPQLWALGLLAAASRPGREIARWQRATLVASDVNTWAPTERNAVLARAEVEAEAVATTDRWLRTWFALDPRRIARDVSQPTLVVHGENDRQVPAEQADELAAVLPDARAVRLPHLNHLLLTDFDGDPRGYVRLTTRRVSGDVLRTLVTFLTALNGSPPFSEGNRTQKNR